MKAHLNNYNILIILTILLGACSEPVTYAPVKDVNQALPPDNGYVPQALPRPAENAANKPATPQLTKRATKPEQTLTPTQPAKPVLKTTKPVVSDVKTDGHNTHVNAKTAKQTPRSKADVADVKQNSEKILNGSHIHKSMVSKRENPKLKIALNDTIHPLDETKNGVKNAQKNSVNDYKSNSYLDNRDKGAKKLVKTLDKLEISGKNSKNSSNSIDNKKLLKLNFQWPLQGRLSRSFSQTDNKGIEIAGKAGQTVYAAEAGKAVYCGHGLAGFGNLAIIKHNDIYLSAYANNSRLMVQEGQQVGKGQAIGLLGQSGLKKAALHFEIRKNGKPINPLAVLPQK